MTERLEEGDVTRQGHHSFQGGNKHLGYGKRAPRVREVNVGERWLVPGKGRNIWSWEMKGGEVS